MENRPRRDLVSIRTVLDRSNSATPHQSEADGTQSLPDGHASITDNTHTAAPPAPTAAAAAPPSGANNESLLSLSTLVTIPQPPQLQGGGNVDAATHALPSQTGTTEDDGILVDKTDLQDDAHHAILGGTGTGAKPPRPTSARARPGSARSRPGSARRVTATTAPLLGATPGATGAQASSISEDASPLDKGSRGSDIPQLRESSDLNVNDPSSRAGSTPHGQGSEAARSASSQATTPDVAIPDFSHRSGSRLSATEDDVGAPLEDTAVGSNPQAVDVNDKQSSRSALQAGEAAATEQQAKVDAVTDMSDRPVEQLDQPERQPSGSKDGSAPERQSPTLPSDGRITDQAEVRKDEPDGSAEERIAVTSTSEEGAEAVGQKSPAPVVSEIKESVVDQNGRSSESEEKLEEVSLAPQVLFGATPPSATAIPRAAPASMPAVDVNRFWHNEDEEDEQLLRMEESELAAARALTAAIASRAALSSSFPSLPGGTTSDSAQDTTSVKEATQEEAAQEAPEEEGVENVNQNVGLSSSGAQLSAAAPNAEWRAAAEVEESEKAAADAPSNVAASNPSAVGGAAPNTAGSPEAQANVGLTPPEGVRFVDRVNSDRDVAPQVEQDHERQEQARGREEALRAQPMDEVGRLSETASRDAEEQKRPSATSVDIAHAEMVRFVNPPADATVPLGDQPSGNAQSSNNASVVSKRSTTSQKIELSTPGPTPSDSIPVQLSGTASDAGTKDSRHRHRRKHRRRRQTSDAAPSFTAAGSPEGAADSVVRDLGTSVADAARVDSLESEATDAGRKRLEPSSDALPPARVLEMPVQTPSTVQQEEVVEAAILATPGHDDQRAERKDKDGKPSSHRRRRHHRDRRASADVENSAKATDQSPVETTPSSATVPPLPSSRPDFSAANHDDENIQVHGVPAVLHAQEIPHAQEPSPPIAHGVRSDAGVDRKGPDSPPPSPNGGATDTTRQDPPVVVADASEDAESPIEAQPSSSVVLEVEPPPPRGTAAPGTTNVTLQNTGVEEGSSPAESSACDAATPVEALPSSSVVLEGQEDDFRAPLQPSAEPQSRAGVAAHPASESAESPVEALPSSSVVLEGQRSFGDQPSSAEPQVKRSTDDGRPASADDFLRRSGRGGAATISDVDVVECEARAYVLSDEADALASITTSFGGASARALVEEKETAARQDFISSERQARKAAVQQGLLLRSAQQRRTAADNAPEQVASTSHHDVSASGHNSASDVAVQRSPMDEDTDAVARGAGDENAPNQFPVPVPVGEGGDKQEATPLAPAEIINNSSNDNDHGGAEEEVPSKDSPDDVAEDESTAAAIAAAAVTGSVEDAVSLAVIGAATEATIENVAVAALVAEETNIRLDINESEQKALYDATTEHELIVKSDAKKRAHEECQRLDRVTIEENEHQRRTFVEAKGTRAMTQLQRSSNDEAETIRRSASQAVAQEFAVTVLVGEAEGQTRDARTTQEEFELRRLLERRFDMEKSELLDRNALGDVATLSGEELMHRHVIEAYAVSTRAALQSQAMLDLNEVQKTVVPVPVLSQKAEKSPAATPPPQSPLQALLAQITASPKPDRPLTTTNDPSANAEDISVASPKENSAKVGSPEVGRSQSPVAAALEEAAQGFVVAILVEAAEAQARDTLTVLAEPQARALLEEFCEINRLELIARGIITNSTSLELEEALARGDVERSEVDADLSLRTARQFEAVAVRQQAQKEEASADTAEAVADPSEETLGADLSTPTRAESAETTTTPSREAAPDSSRTPKTPNLGAPLQALLAQITRSPADRSISSSKPTPTDRPALPASADSAAPPLGPLGNVVPTIGAPNTNANLNSLTGDGSVGRSGFAVAGSSARALLPPAVVASTTVGSNIGAKVNGDGDASSPMDAPALITTTTRGRPSVPIIGGRGRPSVPFTPSASGISFSPTGRASLSARGRGPSSSARMSRSVSPTASSPDGRTWRQRKSFIAGDIDDEGSRERLERARQYRASSRSAERSDGGDSFVDGTSPFGPTPAHALIETTPEAGAVIEATSPAPFNNGTSGLEPNESIQPTTPEAVKPSSVNDDPVTPKTPEVGHLLEGGDASPGLASDGAAQETMLPPDVTETEAGAHATSAASTPDGRSPFDDDHPDALDNVPPKAAGLQVQGQGENSDVTKPSAPIANTVRLPSVHRTVTVVRRSPSVVVKMIPRRMVTTSVFKSTPSLVRKSRPIRQRTFATVRATPTLTRKFIPARVFVHAVRKQTPVVTREIVLLSSTMDEGAAPSVLEGYRKELSVLESQQGAASSTRTVQISEESLLRAGLTDAQIAAVLSGRAADGAPASSVSVVDDHAHATDRGPAGRELGEKDENLHITTRETTDTDGVEPALLDHQTQPDIVLPVADVGAVDPVRDVVDATDENASPRHVQESGSETPVEQHTVDEPGAAEPGDAVVVLPLEEPRSVSVGREVQTDDLVVEDPHPRSASVGREVQTDDLTTAEDDEKRRHEQQELVSEGVSVGMHGLMSLFFQEQERRDKLVREEHMRRFLMKDEQEVEVIARQFDNPRSITARLETMESAARTVLLVNMEWQAAHFTQCASLLFEKLHRAHVTTMQEKYERIRCEDAKDFIIFQARSGGFGGYGNERREHGARAPNSDRRSGQAKDEEGSDGSVPLTPTAPAQDQAARNQSRRELYADRTIGAGEAAAAGTWRKGPRLFTAAPCRSHGGTADVFASAATKATERLAAFPSPQQYARTNVEVRPDDGLEMMRTRGDGGGLATCLFARKEHADSAAASSVSPANDHTAVPSSERTLETNEATSATDAVGAEADTRSIPPLAETPATHNGDTATDAHRVVDGGDDNGHEQAPPSVVDSFEDTMRSCYTPFGAIPRLAPTPDHEATNGSLPTPRSAAYHHQRPMSSTTPGVKRPTAPGPRPPSGRPPQRPASAAVVSRSTDLEIESKKNGWGDQGEVAPANRQAPNEQEQETDGATASAMSGKDGVDATQEKVESEERENFFGRRPHETQFPSTYSPAALPQRLIPRRPCASPQRTAVDRTVSPPRLVPSSREHVPAPSMNSHGQSVGRDGRTHQEAPAVEREHGSVRSGASATQPHLESATEEAAFAVVRVIPSPQRQCPARFDGTTPVVAAKESPARDRTVNVADDEEEQRNASQDNSPAAAAAAVEEGEAIARTPTPPPAAVARSETTSKTTNRLYVSGSGAQTPRASATTGGGVGATVTPQRPATAAARRGVPFPGRRMSAPDRPGSTLPAVAGAGSRVPTRPASVASGASNGGPLRHGVLPSNRKILSNAASSRTVDSW